MFGKGSWGRRLVYTTGFVGVLGFGGGYAAYQRRLRENRSITAEDFNAKQNQQELHWALSNLASEKGPKTLLYRYSTCPFCGTAKAILDYAKIPHECVEVEPMLKKEIAKSEYKKVPQLQFVNMGGNSNGEGPYLVDSEIIVEKVASVVGLGHQLTDEDIRMWRQWARGPLVRLMTLDFNSSLLAAWRGYSYIDDIDTIPYANKLFLKVVGAPVMFLVARNITTPRLIKSGDLKEGQDPKKRLHEEIDRFVGTALKDGKTGKEREYHGGAKPDLADLDVYGVLQAVRGHRVYDDIIASTNIKPWLDAMDKQLGNPAYKSKSH